MSSLSVGSRVEVWLGDVEEQSNAALFYRWRKCSVTDLDRSRVRVRYNQADREDEWIDLASDRLRMQGGARIPTPPTATQPPPPPPPPQAHQPPAPPPTLPPDLLSDAPHAESVSSASDGGLSDADVSRFYDVVDHPSASSTPSTASSASPTSIEAARLIAAQGVDTSFFAALTGQLSASALAAPRSQPPPLPANIPPPRPAAAKGSSLSPPITSPAFVRIQHSPSRSLSHPIASSSDPSQSTTTAMVDTAPPLPPAQPMATPLPSKGAVDLALSAPQSFEQFSELQGRPDPDRYQIYLQQWHAQHPPLDGCAPPSPIPNGRPPLTSLPVSTQLPASLPAPLHPSSGSTPRKSSTDLNTFSAPEVLTDFARELGKGSLVDVWKPKARQWMSGEVVDVSQSAEKGSMINVIDHTTQTREWMRRASRRIAEPFTNSTNPAAPSPPPSPVRPLAPPKKAASDVGVQQKVSAALSSLSTAASAAASSAAAALLPASVISPRSTSANGMNHQPTSFSANQQKPGGLTQVHSPTMAAAPLPAPAAQQMQTSASSSSSSSSSTLIPIPSAAAVSSVPPPSGQQPAILPQVSPTSQVASDFFVAEPALGFGHSLVVGSLLDALDTDDKWRLAEVIQASSAGVNIHYQGWGTKWDEWVDRDSPRLQPPRSHTVGDTGYRAAPPLQPQPIAHPVLYPSFSSHSPYVPPPSYTLPAKPSSRYDCRGECKWRRVLSMGLGHREMQSLDLLFARCCQLQDDYGERVLVQEEQNPQLLRAFKDALSTVTSDIERVKQSLPSFASFYTSQCLNIVRTIESGISETEEAVKRQMLAMQEASYMHRLKSQFQLVEVPPDGSCLFAAVGKGMAHRAEQMHLEEEQRNHPPPIPASHQPPPPPPDSPSLPPYPSSSAAEAPLDAPMLEGPSTAKDEPPHSHSIAVPMEDAAPPPNQLAPPPPPPPPPPPAPASPPPPPASPFNAPASPRHLPHLYRKQTVHHLLSNPAFHASIRHEVREALIQEREGHGDATSALIRQELQRRCGQSPEQVEQALEGDEALQVYASVMEKEGIYGTQLEVEALSSALHVPIHIYYRAGTEHDGAGGEQSLPLKPTQIIGEQEKGPPLQLAYYMGDRHYNLLVPKPPPPPPQPVPIPVPAPSAAPAKPDQELSLSHLSGVDDELMVALLENGTPSPLPPIVLGASSAEPGAAGVAEEGQSLKRARSSGHLTIDQSPGSEEGSGSGSALRIRKRGESKDELHLLTAAPSSTSNVRSLVSRWDAGAPTALLTAARKERTPPLSEHLTPPLSTAAAGDRTSPSSSRSPSRRSSAASRERSVSPSRSSAPAVQLVVHAPLSSAPTTYSVPLHRPLRVFLYSLPVPSSVGLVRLADQSQLDLDLTPLDYHFSDGEQLRVMDGGAALHSAHANASKHPSPLPVISSHSSAAAAGEGEAAHPPAEQEVADAVHAMVEQVAHHDHDQQKPDDTSMTE